MKVKDLLKILKKCNPDFDIFGSLSQGAEFPAVDYAVMGVQQDQDHRYVDLTMYEFEGEAGVDILLQSEGE